MPSCAFPACLSSTSTNHSLMTPAVSSFPDVTRPELKVRGRPFFVLTLYVRKTRKCHRGSGIELFQIVLGLMCPRGLCRGGKSQNEAKSRRFGVDLPCRAFYEGVNPKTVLNNCQQRPQKGQQSPQDHRQKTNNGHRPTAKGYGETDKRPAEASKGPQTTGKTG